MKPFDPATAEATPAPATGEPALVPRVRQPLWLWIVLGALALVAIAGPLAAVLLAPPPPPELRLAKQLSKQIKRQRHVVSKAELPAVEPAQVLEIAPETARQINAAIAFSSAPNPAARPFRIFGAAADRARATDCLASAVYYEAGDDPVGQRAVAQVVLNRVRHPAFPKSVCGVVYQGQERSTGCQFTFTCDGAIARYGPGEAAWKRARQVAQAALTGSVYKPVGHATHYHTDWVVPYWSSSLDKITSVGTHLFFRWTGWWGTPPAFTRNYAGAEPNIPKLARLSTAHVSDGTEATAPPMIGVAAADAAPDESGYVDLEGLANVRPGTAVSLKVGRADVFIIAIARRATADSLKQLALSSCANRPVCKLMAWNDPAKLPDRLPLGVRDVASMSFSYLRDQSTGFEKALWNCADFPRTDLSECMKAQVMPATSPGAPPAIVPTLRPSQTLRADPPVNLNVPIELNGVRRRPGQGAAPAAAPTPSAGTGSTSGSGTDEG